MHGYHDIAWYFNWVYPVEFPFALIAILTLTADIEGVYCSFHRQAMTIKTSLDSDIQPNVSNCFHVVHTCSLHDGAKIRISFRCAPYVKQNLRPNFCTFSHTLVINSWHMIHICLGIFDNVFKHIQGTDILLSWSVFLWCLDRDGLYYRLHSFTRRRALYP